MRKFFLLLTAGLILPVSAMAQELPNARYLDKDSYGIVEERGIAENQSQFAQHGVPILGLIDLEVFKVQVPLKQIKKAKTIIDNAINKATHQPVMMNVGYSEDQQHMGDIQMGNGFRSGMFIGGVEKNFKITNLLKADTAFLKLPAVFNQNNTDNVIISDATKEYLSGFKLKVTMDSSKNDEQKNVTYHVQAKTKSNPEKNIWKTDSYKLTLQPGEQQFFYTLPKENKKSKEVADVYVFALYPYVRMDYYNQ